MKQKPSTCLSSTGLLITGALVLTMTASAQTPLSLMPLPSSITVGHVALTVTPAGGGPSTFTYTNDKTHDPRLEAAVRRALIRLGRTCGGEVLRSTIDHPTPPNPSPLINAPAPAP